MKRLVIVFGVIAGLITSGWLVIAHSTGISNDMDTGMFLGYASMILAFSLIFVGIKTYRDKYNDGVISFGKAFSIGFWITLIASTVYVLVWLIMYFNFIPDFSERYTQLMVDKMNAANSPESEIALKKAEMQKFSAMYKNPLFNALVTYTEILPVGLFVSLICSFILIRKNRLPENVPAVG